jgi:predicted ABC-type ATPase
VSSYLVKGLRGLGADNPHHYVNHPRAQRDARGTNWSRPSLVVSYPPVLPGSVFVNADEIAKQRWPEDAAEHAYDAALIAAETRAKLIELGRPFIAETVFSHPSKLDLIDTAHTAGYTVVRTCC